MNAIQPFETLESRRLLAFITGAVMQDFDGDGQVDAGERPIAGVEVFLDANGNDVLDPGEVSTTTTSDGYQFTVEPGTYRVAQVQRTNSLRTFPGTGRLIMSHDSGGYSGIYEVSPATGRIAQHFNDAGYPASTAVRGDFVYTYNPVYSGMTGSILREHFVTGEKNLVTLTQSNLPTSNSVLMGNELFLRGGTISAPTITVLDLSTGAVRRTLSLPASTGYRLAAMPDHGSLLVVNATELLWVDPNSGAITRTITRTGSAPSGLPRSVAYMNGSAYLQWSTAGYVRADVVTGAVSPGMLIEGGGTLLTHESSSHIVNIESPTQWAYANFQQGEYSSPAEPPVVLSATNGFRPDSTIRVAINGTTAGAKLMLYHPVVSQRDRNYFVATASEGTTVLELKGSDIAHVDPTGFLFTHGIAVLQTQPFKMVQPHTTTTLLSSDRIVFNYAPPAGPGLTGWTSNSTPTFTIAPGGGQVSSADIELYANGIRVASAPYSNNVVPIRPAEALAQGSYDFAALVRLRQAPSEPVVAWQDHSPLSVTLNIDYSAPTVALTYAFNEATPALELAFSEPVLNREDVASSLMISRLDSDGSVLEAWPVSWFDMSWTDDRVLWLATASGTFPDGVYRLGMSPYATSTVRDRAGNPLSPVMPVDTFVLAGDVNRDRAVNFDDLLILAQNYGQSGRTFSQGNINYSADGLVDFGDLLNLAQQYGKSIPFAFLTATPKRKASVLTRIPIV